MAGRMLHPAGLSSMGTAFASLRAVDFPKGTILNGLTSQLGIAFKQFLTYCWALHAGTASGCESRLFHLPPSNASGLIAGICKLLPVQAALESLCSMCVSVHTARRPCREPKHYQNPPNYSATFILEQRQCRRKWVPGWDIFASFLGRERLSWDQRTSLNCWVVAEQLLLQPRVQERAQSVQLGGIFLAICRWKSLSGICQNCPWFPPIVSKVKRSQWESRAGLGPVLTGPWISLLGILLPLVQGYFLLSLRCMELVLVWSGLSPFSFCTS